MTLYLAAFLLGVIAGLRAVTPVAAVSWAAALGALKLSGTPLGFLGAAGGAVDPLGDRSRRARQRQAAQDPQPQGPDPVRRAASLTGGLAGAAVGLPSGALLVGIVLGVVGAVAGTFGGAAARGALARAFGRDLPAALVEDLVAVAGAALIVRCLL